MSVSFLLCGPVMNRPGCRLNSPLDCQERLQKTPFHSVQEEGGIEDGWMDGWTSTELIELCRMSASTHKVCTHQSLSKVHCSLACYLKHNQSITAATWCIQACRRGDDDLLRCRLSARLAVKSGLTWIGMRWTWWLVPDSLSVSQTAEDWLQNRNYPVSKMYEE